MTKVEEPHELSCSEKDKYDLWRQIAKRGALIALFEQFILILKYPEFYKAGAKEHIESRIEQLKSQII